MKMTFYDVWSFLYNRGEIAKTRMPTIRDFERRFSGKELSIPASKTEEFFPLDILNSAGKANYIIYWWLIKLHYWFEVGFSFQVFGNFFPRDMQKIILG